MITFNTVTHIKHISILVKMIYLSFWREGHFVVLEHFNESHFSLHESKPHSNAVSGSSTKRHVTTGVTVSLLFSSKPVNIYIKTP